MNLLAVFCVPFTAIILCTITPSDRLLDAIAQVESENGSTSPNVYQLTPAYIEDVYRITGRLVDPNNREESRQAVREYLTHYGRIYMKTSGHKKPNDEVFARIHNGGPNGWRKQATAKYWKKIKQVLTKGEK